MKYGERVYPPNTVVQIKTENYERFWTDSIEPQIAGWEKWTPEEFDDAMARFKHFHIQTGIIIIKALSKGLFLDQLPLHIREWHEINSRVPATLKDIPCIDSEYSQQTYALVHSMLGACVALPNNRTIQEFMPEMHRYYLQALVAYQQTFDKSRKTTYL